MKTTSTILTIALGLTLGARVAAQGTDQNLMVEVFYNSNQATQQSTFHTLLFSNLGTNGLDVLDLGDSTNIIGSTNAHPFTRSAGGDIITQKDSRPPTTTYRSVDLGFYSMSPATISITCFGFSSYNYAPMNGPPVRPMYCVLECIATGQLMQIKNDTVTLNIPANTNWNLNYRLHFGPMAYTSTLDETCFNSNDGTITVAIPDETSWKLDLYKNGVLQFSNVIAGMDTTIYGLQSGNYTSVVYVGMIRVDSSVHVLASPVQIVAGFTASAYSAFVNSNIDFTSTTTGATTYTWDFGDGGIDSIENSSHVFFTVGTFTVLLTAYNGVCQSTNTQVITIALPPVAPNNNMNFNPGGDPAADSSNGNSSTVRTTAPVVVSHENMIEVKGNNEPVPFTVQVMSLDGKLIARNNSNGENMEMNVPNTGIYMVMITYSNGEMFSEKIMVQ